MCHFKTTLHTMEPFCDHLLELHDFSNIDALLLSCTCMSHNNHNVIQVLHVCQCVHFNISMLLYVDPFCDILEFYVFLDMHFQVCILLSLPKSNDQMLRKKLQSLISLISFMALTISLANINSKILNIQLLFHLLLHIHHVHIILSITFKKETVNFLE